MCGLRGGGGSFEKKNQKQHNSVSRVRLEEFVFVFQTHR